MTANNRVQEMPVMLVKLVLLMRALFTAAARLLQPS